MKMKRKLAALLSVLMIFGAFSGCGNTDSSEEIATPTTTVTTTAAATAAPEPEETTAATTAAANKPEETAADTSKETTAVTTEITSDDTSTTTSTAAPTDKATSADKSATTVKTTTAKTTTSTAKTTTKASAKTTTKSPATTTAKTTTKAAATTTKKPAATTTAKAPDPDARRVVLPVKNIQMLPELPSGSEVTSAAMILNYFGINVSKMELIDYLPIYKDPAPVNGVWGNPYTVFVGHPTKPNSVGYERVLKECIDAYFAKNNITDHETSTAKNSFYEYIQEIKKGNLVMMWVTVGMKDIIPANFEDVWESDDGYRHWMIGNSNCVVMCGYDLDKNTVIICDPADPKGTVEYPMDRVEEIHNTLVNQSVVVRKK